MKPGLASHAERFDGCDRAAVDPRIPVRMVIGEQGAGKTTFLAVETARGHGARAAVLFTEHASFETAARGSQRLSRRLARTRDGVVLSEMNNDLRGALYQLHLRRLELIEPALDYDRVVIEVGARAELESLVRELHNDMRLDLTYRFEGVTAIVDAAQDCGHADTEVACRIAKADRVVLSKADLAGRAAIEVAARAVDAINPFAPISAAIGGQRTSRLALPPRADLAPVPGSGDPDDSALCFARNYYRDARSNAEDAVSVRAARILIPGKTDIMQTMGAICSLHGSLRDGLHRLRARLNICHAAYPVALDVIGGAAIPPAYAAPIRTDRSEVTIVARDLDVKEAFDAFRQCAQASAGFAEWAVQSL